MKRNLEIMVKGRSGREYGFLFKGDPKYLEEWRSEGFDIDEVVNIIPEWAVDLGLLRPWIAVQDAWRWLRIW